MSLDYELRTPREILSDVNSERKTLLSAIVKQISEELENKYDGNPIYAKIYGITKEQVGLVEVQLTNTFQEKGWKIEIADFGYQQDQRDDSWVTFNVRERQKDYFIDSK